MKMPANTCIRSLYIDRNVAGGAPQRCRVLQVSPLLRGATKSALDEGVEAVLEIVIDGLSAPDIAAAMRAGIAAACAPDLAGGVVAITAGNYGGKLGQFHFHLREIMQ